MNRSIRGTSLPCSPIFSRSLRNTVLITGMLTLAACGGGSGGSGNSLSDTYSSDASGGGTSATTGVLQGSIGDGPIVGATVSVIDADGDTIATTTSDENASYTLSLPDNPAYPLTVVASGGTDLVTNRAPDFAMSATVLAPTHSTANVNPFSTLATQIAEQMPNGLSAATHGAASSYVLRYLGFGLDPELVPDPTSTPVDARNVANLVKASETIAETMRRTAEAMRAAGTPISAEKVLAALAGDASDGAVDGQGPGASARLAATLNVVAGQVLSEALINALRVQGQDATARLDAAIARTEPDATMGTAQVPVSAHTLEQAELAINAARMLLPNLAVPSLADAHSQLPAEPLPADLATILPEDTSYRLSAAVAIAASAPEEQLAMVNDAYRSAAVGDNAYQSFGYSLAGSLLASGSAQRSAPVPLQGQILRSDVFVFTDPTLQAQSVSFYIDDPFKAGQPYAQENVAPFDLNGTAGDNSALPFPTSQLADGAHTISAQIRLADGSTKLEHASFVVDNIDGTTTALQLTWNSDAGAATGYQVLFGETAETAVNLLVDLPVSQMSDPTAAPRIVVDPVRDLGYTDLSSGPVCFRVRAYNEAGVSAPSEAACMHI